MFTASENRRAPFRQIIEGEWLEVGFADHVQHEVDDPSSEDPAARVDEALRREWS